MDRLGDVCYPSYFVRSRQLDLKANHYRLVYLVLVLVVGLACSGVYKGQVQAEGVLAEVLEEQDEARDETWNYKFLCEVS
jgi:hypothetical protein